MRSSPYSTGLKAFQHLHKSEDNFNTKFHVLEHVYCECEAGLQMLLVSGFHSPLAVHFDQTSTVSVSLTTHMVSGIPAPNFEGKKYTLASPKLDLCFQYTCLNQQAYSVTAIIPYTHCVAPMANEVNYMCYVSTPHSLAL